MNSFKHSGDGGDVIYSLPCLREFLRIANSWRSVGGGALYLEPSEGGSYFGGTHFSERVINWMLPLLREQPYLDKVELWNEQEAEVDLNTFRKLPADLSKGNLASHYFWAHPVRTDLGKPWIFLKERIDNDYILVNRTARYRNNGINYRFLEKEKNVGFLGYSEEFEEFRKQVPNAVCFTVQDHLEMAQFIAGCRCFIGNQSFAFAIAEAIKVKRLLEVFPSCPNVQPMGPNGYDAINQLGFEHNFGQIKV